MTHPMTSGTVRGPTEILEGLGAGWLSSSKQLETSPFVRGNAGNGGTLCGEKSGCALTGIRPGGSVIWQRRAPTEPRCLPAAWDAGESQTPSKQRK